MNHLVRATLLSAGWAMACACTFGQSASTDTLAKGALSAAEVVHTGIRPAISSASPTQRLDSAAIRSQGITDTGDALRRLAGVNLRDYGGAGGLKTVSIRGLGATHTAVTYDGLAVTDAQQGQVDLQRFSLERLGSLELQTLDNATLLCPVRNLAAAAIHLYSALPEEAAKPLQGTLTLRQASWNVYNPTLILKHKATNRTTVTASADYFFGLNDYPFHVENGVASEDKRRNNSRMQAFTLEANLLHRFTPTSLLQAKAYYYLNHRRLPGIVTLYVDNNNERMHDQNAFAQIRQTYTKGRWELFAAMKYNWQENRYTNIDAQYPGGALRQNYKQNEAYVTLGAAYTILPQLKAAYAADYAYDALKSNLSTDNDVSRHTLLQALSLQWKDARWNIQARAIAHLAYNHVDASSEAARHVSKLSPSLSVSYLAFRKPLWLFLRAGFKQSFREPTFTESYYYHLGSTTLKPERARQLNLGFTLQASPTTWWPELSLTADAYHNRVKNRIVSIPYNLYVWRTVNMGMVHSTGGDFTIQSHWQPAKRHALILSTNYSIQSSREQASEIAYNPHVQLAYTPLHSGAASLAWENPWANLVVHATFASERWSTIEHTTSTRLPPYIECGWALYRSFHFNSLRIDARADLINAFDKRYEIIRRYPMPGRAYKLSLSLHF